MSVTQNKRVAEADRLIGKAEHFWYGDGGDTATGTAAATQAVAEALLAALPDREFEIRKAALLASASVYENRDADFVIKESRRFEAYLRGESK